MGIIFPYKKKFKPILDAYKLQYYNHSITFLFVIAFTLSTFSGNAVTYYVSSTGNDTNAGTSESHPWRTLSKVNSFYKLFPGDQILFKRGDEWTGSLTINVSGKSGSPVVYGAYGTGDKPKIYGSKVITGWTLHSGNIYKASFATDITQLFVNGEKMKLARLTNSGYSTVNSVTSQTQFTCNALDAGFIYSGARVMMRTENWYSIMRTVTSSNSKTLTINSTPTGTIKANQGFLLMNKLVFLDSPGEWYYDTATKMVYLWTHNGDSPANYEVRGSVEANGIYHSGKNYVTIQDLHILQQKETGIQLASIGGVSCTNIIVQRNLITGQEGFGIWDESTNNQYFTIQNNEINDCNGIGIHAWIKNSIIRDNVITNIGLFDKLGLNGTWNNNGGTGIEISGNGNIIEYNRVIGTNYNGIFWRGNSILQYNLVKNACLYKSDGGGIYTGGTTTAGSTIRYNIIDNVVGNKEGGITGRNMSEGIYLDEPSLNITCEYNTIVHCSNAGIMLHKSENHIIRHNTIMDARYGIFVALSSGTVKSSITYNTIATNSATNDYEPQQLAVRYASANAIFDNNTYLCPFASDLVFRISDDSYKNFASWKILIGSDYGSKYINTQFGTGETQEIFYNDTKQIKTYKLGNSVFRDIYGKTLKDTFSLKPFTSKILIGKNFNSINQSPSIMDQSFNIISPKIKNDFIGKVNANDSDAGQVISYFIVQGNEKGLFSINSKTGEIYAKTDIQTSKDKSVELIVQVSDNAVNSLSDTAKVNINITGTDTSPPTISSFSISSIAISLTIPVTTFNAEDDIAVKGYKLTETSTIPLASESGWMATAPSNFTFSREGVLHLYAWAKDSAGNISGSVHKTVKISLPDMSPTYSEYLFEESDSTIIDSKGTNNGTIHKEGFRNNGVIGKGIEFTGSGYINLGYSFGETVQNEITLSAWIKPTAMNGDYQGIIMHGGPNVDSYALYIHPDSKGIGFKTSGTTNDWVKVENVNDVWDGNWHHLLVTYNGTEKVIYVDNIPLIKIESSGKIDTGWGYNLLIGAGRDEVNPTLLYEGLIDEVRIYNYALTISQIGDLYHSVNKINKKIFTTEYISVCEGEEYKGWSASGHYQRVLQRLLQSASGADSIISTVLRVNPIYKHKDEVIICEGDTYFFGTQTLKVTGKYTEIFESINGCDSTVFLTLIVNPSYNKTHRVIICEEEIYNFGNQTLNATGNYTEIFKTVNGCDSTVVLALIVNPKYYTTDIVSICKGETFSFGTQTLNESGQYTEIFETINGCDSTVFLNLNVNPGYYKTENAFICEGEIYTFGAQNLNITGEYTEIFKTDNGCDSIIVLKLTVNPSYYVTKKDTICEGETYTFGNLILSTTGNYTQIFENVHGCDSTVFLLLTVNPVYKISQNITISSEDNYMGWTTEGTYIRVLISSTGCDSIVTTNLSVKQRLTQNISLDKGWNIFSSWLIPVNENMDSVMQTLRIDGKLVKIQDEKNNIFEEMNPQIGWINNIGKLQKTEGYKIRVESSSNLEIKGWQIDLPLSILLNKGLNIISFPINKSLDAMQVIESLIDAGILEKVQDERGNAIEYWGNIGWINGIGNLNSGEGYIIHVKENGVLIINEPTEKSYLFLANNSETSYFRVNYEGNGFDHMNINIMGLTEAQLTEGDEIAVYDNNICVGAVKLTENHFIINAVSIPASASEVILENGFIDGNPIELKVWDKTTNEVVKLLPEVIEGKMIYTRQASVFVKLNNPSVYSENINIYPNPASDKVYIRFSSIPEEGANIILLDITGKQLLSRVVQSNIEIINIKDLPVGVYFIKTFIKNKYTNHKLMII